MKYILKVIMYILLSLLGIFVLLQLVPVKRTNPPVTSEIKLPPEMKKIVKKACYDCHSNETKWPWYSYIAPVSWTVAHDVNEGRRELNFSEWGTYSERRRRKKIEEIWEEVEERKMPMPLYIVTHPEALLTKKERLVIKKWTHSQLNPPKKRDAKVDKAKTDTKPKETPKEENVKKENTKATK